MIEGIRMGTDLVPVPVRRIEGLRKGTDCTSLVPVPVVVPVRGIGGLRKGTDQGLVPVPVPVPVRGNVVIDRDVLDLPIEEGPDPVPVPVPRINVRKGRIVMRDVHPPFMTGSSPVPVRGTGIIIEVLPFEERGVPVRRVGATGRTSFQPLMSLSPIRNRT